MPAASPLPVLVVSCSLNASSRSHRLACAARTALRALDVDVELIDLRDWELPFCDGGGSYEHPSVAPLAGRIERAAAVLVAAPVYNYDLNAAAKNLVELTGSAWSEKPVGFLCAAGARSSYMSPIGLANSLMFDFRSLIIPRFVYAVKDDFDAHGELAEPLRARVEQLARTAVGLARALARLQASNGAGPEAKTGPD